MWVSDSNWILVDSYKYDSFWNLVDFESTIGNTRLYTGREFDVNTGLYYNRARYYDPVMGRFISRDPIDVGDDVNLYRYVGNGPVKFVDLMGMAAKEFTVAYDNYLDLKSQIYNMNWGYDWWFLLKNQDEQLMLLNKYNEARDKARELHYNRNKYNTNLPKTDEQAKSMWWRKLANNKSVLHQINIPKDKWNDKWVSKDWKKEVVYLYNSNWDIIVNDETNMGTYNFYSPDDMLNHIDYDVKPCKEWWNWINDKSTYEQRSVWTRWWLNSISD